MKNIEKLWKELVQNISNMERISTTSFKLGITAMVCFYIIAIASKLLAPFGNYLAAMSLARGCLEAAPACLASGVCAGLLCDLILSQTKKEDKNDSR